jgi:S1-C subfamily serine protease
MLRLTSLLLIVGAAAAAAESGGRTPWERTLERVVPGVVALRVSVPRAFDTQQPANGAATGFVVDAEQGLILTNRHVVNPGPVVAEAVFLDHSEVAVRAVYRDPVHDFGFYRYDPAEVRFMRPAELDLRPDLARIGTEIRVVGNDAGEKLSILTGTLARLDREAPRYGQRGYNDFNTFYYQAASSTSGGSSGSPVVDAQGRVVALNAGGSRNASSSFYLPLERVVRALELIRRGEPVTRGTLHSVFVHQPYDEARRLGLRPTSEAALREIFPDGTGVLIVGEVLPGGAADGALEVGDVLLRADGEWVTTFTPLEALLDARVGGSVRLDVERAGELLSLELGVRDLHAVTPAEYLEAGGGVLHPLSYQLARNYGVPIAGIYVASPGYALSQADVPPLSVITSIDGEPATSLDVFEARLAALPHGARVPLRYFRLEDPGSPSMAVLSVDRRWFPMQRCVRDDGTGLWPCRPSPGAPPPRAEAAPQTIRFRSDAAGPAGRLAPSLALVEFGVPYRIEGVHGDRFVGTGVVVDAERGLVVVDRETVPVPVGDVRLTFAGSVVVPGRVVTLHPVHNLAVVAYDPALLGETPVKGARLDSDGLDPGERVWLVGLEADHTLVSLETRVARHRPVDLALSDPPRFRETNLELIELAGEIETVGGVLADGRGRVRALWAAFSSAEGKLTESFFGGIPAAQLETLVRPLRQGLPLIWRTLGAELRSLPIAEARGRGLSDARILELAAANDRRQVLAVERLTAGTDAARQLAAGDLLVAIGGVAAPGYEDVERLAQAERVRVRVARDGREREIELATHVLDGRGTDRFLAWSGALLHRPHHALAAQKGIAPVGVYAAWFWFGSPANRDGLRATHRIVAVDDAPTPDLDAFLDAMQGRVARDPVRLYTLDLEGTPGVVTLELEPEYWPTVEFRRGDAGWEQIPR